MNVKELKNLLEYYNDDLEVIISEAENTLSLNKVSLSGISNKKALELIFIKGVKNVK